MPKQFLNAIGDNSEKKTVLSFDFETFYVHHIGEVPHVKYAIIGRSSRLGQFIINLHSLDDEEFYGKYYYLYKEEKTAMSALERLRQKLNESEHVWHEYV